MEVYRGRRTGTWNCYNNPREYKFCEDGLCVLNNQHCPCENGLYQCNNGRCIPLSLVCNNRDDCGNNRDEWDCLKQDSTDSTSNMCNLSLGAIIGIGIGAVIFITLCILLIVYWIQRKKRLRSQNTSSLEPFKMPNKNSTDVNSSEGSDVHTRTSGYNKVPLDDSFSGFGEMLCASTPKSDARHQIVRMEPKSPMLKTTRQ